MSAPSPLAGRGRGVARRRGFRQKPIRRPGAKALEDDAAGPEHVYVIPNTWRPMPPGEPDPARAAWIEKLLADPSGAKRELLEAKRSYWQARVAWLELRLEEAEARLRQAVHPADDEDGPAPPVPAVELFRMRADKIGAWADVQAAKARLSEVERALSRLEATH